MSIVDPPPTATTASGSRSMAASMAARKDASVGSTQTSAKMDARMSSASSEAIAVCTGGRSSKYGSVTNITLRTPRSARSAPSSRVTPGPKRMLEVASSTAYSFDAFAIAMVGQSSLNIRMQSGSKRCRNSIWPRHTATGMSEP